MDWLAFRAEELPAGPALAHSLKNRWRGASQQYGQPRAGRELSAGSIVCGGPGHGFAIFEPFYQLLQFEVGVLREQRLSRARQAVSLHERMLLQIAPHAEGLRAYLVKRDGQRNHRDTEAERSAEA